MTNFPEQERPVPTIPLTSDLLAAITGCPVGTAIAMDDVPAFVETDPLKMTKRPAPVTDTQRAVG